jgi:hypothetical protein
MVEGVGSC